MASAALEKDAGFRPLALPQPSDLRLNLALQGLTPLPNNRQVCYA